MQSRIESLVEACVNVVIGACVALVAQLIIFPLLGIPVTLGQNLIITAFFTVISVARSYLVRRYFNSRIKNVSKSVARHLK